jgi:hypothetical protein
MPVRSPEVVVFSKGKADMTWTARWFQQHNYGGAIYVVSDGDDVEMYRRTTGCRVVVAAGAPHLPHKRQWAMDHFTSRSRPWLRLFEDNICHVTAVEESHYHLPRIPVTSRSLYHRRRVGPQDVLKVMLQDIRHAEQVGALFGGYASNDNHFFRKTKYRTVAFVWTKMAYCHRDAPAWPAYALEKDDYAHTAACLAATGRVLVNNYLYPWSKRYEGRGGSRTLEDRADDRRQVVLELHRRYPGLYRDKPRRGYPAGTEVQLRFISERQVDEWRSRI